MTHIPMYALLLKSQQIGLVDFLLNFKTMLIIRKIEIVSINILEINTNF